MNFYFINPFLLTIGLILSCIPIIIHLFFKKRYQKLKWAAMKFLLAAYKKTKRSLLIENFILLLLRILIIVLIALIFGRPLIKYAPLLFSGTRTTESFIILLDNSYSMGLKGLNISYFEKAKNQVRKIIQNAKLNDNISLFLMNDHIENLLSFVTISSRKKKEEILQIVDNLELSYLGTDPYNSLIFIKNIVSKKEYPNKNLFIISDFQKQGWKKFFKSPDYNEIINSIKRDVININIINVNKFYKENIGIIDLKQEGIVGVNRPTKFIATIKNYNNRTVPNIGVYFFINGKKQKNRYISLGPNESIDISFFATFLKKGFYNIKVEIESDRLIYDNKRYLCFNVIDKINILIIDGDPKEKIEESETYYLIAALGNTSHSLIRFKKINLEEFSENIRFMDFDIVILANIQTFPYEKRFKELENYVEEGGNVLIWLGDQVDIKYYNEKFFKPGRELLPGELEGAIGDEKEKDAPFFIQDIAQHPIWRYFYINKRLKDDLKKCLIYKFFPIKIDPNDKNVHVLAWYNDPKHRPVFVERKFGKGKVIVCTTTLDKEWCNFYTEQYGHVFVILIHEFIYYLVSKPSSHNNIVLSSNSMFIKDYNFFIKDAQITTPKGIPLRPHIKVMRKGSIYRVCFSKIKAPGIYKLKLEVPITILEENPDIQNKEYICVNLDSKEGDITSYKKETLLTYFSSKNINYKKDIGKKVQNIRKYREYWKNLLLILILLAIIESYLAMLFGRNK